ncbi:toll/interleukin-1 receptor domain-containing protein [Verrucomicrobiota bacterium sgz303538]
MSESRYCAFISYRHVDNAREGRRWAEWLHRAIEHYTVPPDLVGTTNIRGETIQASLYPIFRDEDELPAHADLGAGISAALKVSSHLIVICSPRSAISPWVRKEVREFKELGRANRILAVMIAGEPNADDPAKARDGILPEEECFCRELRFGVMRGDGIVDWSACAEPLAADLRPGGMRAEGFITADAYREHLTLNSALAAEKISALTEAYRARLDLGLLKVVAGLLGTPLSELTKRDAAHRAAMAEKELTRQREIAERERFSAEVLQRRNRMLIVTAAVAIGLAVVAGWLAHRAEVGEQTAKAARETAVRTLYTTRIVNAERLLGMNDPFNALNELRACAPELRQLEWGFLMRKVTWAATRYKGLKDSLPLGQPVKYDSLALAGNDIYFLSTGNELLLSDANGKVFDRLATKQGVYITNGAAFIEDPRTEQVTVLRAVDGHLKGEILPISGHIGSVTDEGAEGEVALVVYRDTPDDPFHLSCRVLIIGPQGRRELPAQNVFHHSSPAFRGQAIWEDGLACLPQPREGTAHSPDGCAFAGTVPETLENANSGDFLYYVRGTTIAGEENRITVTSENRIMDWQAPAALRAVRFTVAKEKDSKALGLLAVSDDRNLYCLEIYTDRIDLVASWSFGDALLDFSQPQIDGEHVFVHCLLTDWQIRVVDVRAPRHGGIVKSGWNEGDMPAFGPDDSFYVLSKVREVSAPVYKPDEFILSRRLLLDDKMKLHPLPGSVTRVPKFEDLTLADADWLATVDRRPAGWAAWQALGYEIGAVSPDRQTFLCQKDRSFALLRDDGTRLAEFVLPEISTVMAVSNSGSRFAMETAGDEEFTLFQLEGGLVTELMKGHGNPFLFSPDGRRLFVGGRSLELYDSEVGRRMITVDTFEADREEPEMAFNRILLSADAQLLWAWGRRYQMNWLFDFRSSEEP